MKTTINVFASVLLCVLSASSLAKGDDVPVETETTTKCEEAQVWDEKEQLCIEAKEKNVSDAQRYQAVRELAYAGQHKRSLQVLATMSDQNDDRVWTYKGFNARKMGDVQRGMDYYKQALQVNPDNILVRSYMGQAMVEQGNIQAAMYHYFAINNAGGKGTWAEKSLRTAIDTKRTFDY